MRLCKRCGIEFATPGEWCDDCVDVEHPTDLWATGDTHRSASSAEKMEARAQAIRDQWLNGLSDGEIAERLGITSRTVLRWRKRLHLSANNRGGNYGKSEAQLEAQAKRMAGYARSGLNRPKKGSKSWNSTHGISEGTKK